MDLSSAQVISARMELYRTVRNYFEQRNVIEVEVPLLARVAATDPQIESFVVSGKGGNKYLQSSPEFFLKRLIADTRCSCFCVTKAFRDEEHGGNHNPEFSMLEWYRLGFDLDNIIEDCLRLIQICLGREEKITRETYSALFNRHLSIDPHTAELKDLQPLVERHTSYQERCVSVSEALQLLLNVVIEPKLEGLTILRDFPADQAALAKLGKDDSGQEVALRFEIYLGNIELANGYYELTDAAEQRRRFDADNAIREQRGQPRLEVDEKLLQAMEQGLPPCAGVSVGLDRLLMAKMGQNRIDSVLLFPWLDA